MADTNHVRRDDYLEFSENDPFAELTRIMGHDPRVPEQPSDAAAQTAAAPAPDDFSFDLEKELADDFDFSDLDDQPPLADWREEVSASSPEPVGDDASLDLGLDDFFAESFAGQTEEAVAASSGSVDAFASDPVEEGLDDVLERELHAGELEAAPATGWSPDHDVASVPEPVYEAPAAFDAPEADEAGTWEDWTADAEFDLDFLEDELTAGAVSEEVAEDAAAPVAEPDAGFAVATSSSDRFGTHEAPAEAAGSESLSLEEELSLLLSDDPAPAAPPAAAWSAAASAAAASSAALSSGPLGSYGRANFAPAHRSSPAPAFERGETFAATTAYGQPEQAPSPAAVAGTAYADDAAAHDLADDDLAGIFDDDLDLGLDLADETETAGPVAAMHAAPLPEIETVEVSEAVRPVADDLDIPEIEYGSPQAAAGPLDDFEAEFADVFGDLGGDLGSDPVADASPAAPAQAAATPSQAYVPDMQPYMLDDAQWQAAQAFPEADLDYESDLERAIAGSAYEDDEVRPASRRRGLLVAAAIAGIVVLGGAGVFGMSMLGGGSDAPAFVRADPDPMKVRPENPGGATVPNQNNEVYQRVAGGASDAAPEQEQLISSAEEPVDVTARTAPPPEPEVLAPGVEDVESAGLPKSEDRIEPEASSSPTADETAMVTPRRVRTMVVRPDGTMVPREEVAPTQPAAVEQPAAADQALAVPPVQLAAPLASGAPAAGIDGEIDDGPVIDMPETVAVVPTQRTEPQAAPARPAAQPAAVQRPAAQPAAPAAAATPVAAAPVAAAPAAAAAGEWSMQIASQPTAEGAQSTYQDLARRYGGVLQGRGVNIVRADIDGRGTYYRVRIPASSRDEAIQLCTRYKAAGGSCFVSR